MSVSVSGAPSALFSPAQDHAVSNAGAELRSSLQVALAPPRSERNALMFTKITTALKKGSSVEGVFVSVETFGRMFDLLAVLPTAMPLPEIVIESENEIGLDWQAGDRRLLTVSVDDTPYIGFAALFGHEPLHGRMPFAGDVPGTLAYLFGRLYDKREAAGRPAS